MFLIMYLGDELSWCQWHILIHKIRLLDLTLLSHKQKYHLWFGPKYNNLINVDIINSHHINLAFLLLKQMTRRPKCSLHHVIIGGLMWQTYIMVYVLNILDQQSFIALEFFLFRLVYVSNIFFGKSPYP
ncbi:hypothetical protein Ahy_A07g034831 isoform G [Arachis hypogaea]|uniref:Uncharacterized protein n=1 Tax=Arachis hypogaea TaxID=3818 RepID=A0A445CCS6_ARAHY|nr:hypothetical protein Ahy_A07g034831 isoform G [Arachis hypogaea]